MAYIIQYCSIKILNKYIENIQFAQYIQINISRSIYPDQYIRINISE